MIRVLHLADVHLDTTFASRSDRVRRLLRDGLRTAFVKAVDLAVTERMDAVLIAGDLFDGDTLSFTTERLILEQARRLSEARIPTFYATGNHDPSSLRTRSARLDWPDGFHVFRSRTPETVQVLDEGGRPCAVIVGSGHESGQEQDNLAALFPVSSGPVPHVGLLHTMVVSAESSQLHDRYAPCTADDLRRVDYDYWALGHIHTRQRVDEEANAWYSGNIQGRTPREGGRRGALVAHIDRGRQATTEFVPLAAVEWCNIDVTDVESISDASRLEAAVRVRSEKVRSETAADDWIAIVNLCGRCPMEPDLRDPDRRLELEGVLADVLSAAAVEIRTAGLAPPVDVDAYRAQPHLLGETLAVIAELNKRDQLLSDVGPDPLGCTAITEADRIAYLRSLLEGLEEEAVVRLLAEEGMK